MTNPSKRLLLFTAKLGYQTRSFEDAAHKLGVQLVYVTDRCHQLEDPWGDRAIAVHFESPEVAAYTVMEALRGQDVSGILALGDRPAAAAAYAARGLGIRYNHPAAVEACRNKLRMKEVFRDAGLRVPWFRNLAIDPTPEPVLLGISYPCVLKPLSLSASQGVVRANNRAEFIAAAARVRRLLKSPEILATREANLEQMLVEGYIPGREVAIEGLLTDGALSVLAIFDKPVPLEGPYFEETIYVTPSRLPDAEQRAIEQCARDAVRALGLSHGPVHAELRINEDGVWPLEVAPRPIGGLCARALRFSLGGASEPIGLEELLVRHALELPGWNLPCERIASGVMMIPVPESGILEGVSGEEAARSVPGITELAITARLHDAIAAWPEGASYLGFLFARGSAPEKVEQALREAHEKLSFTITPVLPVEHPATRRMTNQRN
ncbi:MAG TPA: ATP-grasp domain-containing protein [Candidatus Acidoferrum sp.]|nr:ATP-grasp domain-containing protein [Candidatus Acidoferrum sp.]